MAVKKRKIKRKINSGLKAWNDARSYISAENRKVNKKYDYLFVNELTKQFLGEHYGKSFDKTDLDYFLTTTFEKFYDVSVKASLLDLIDITYYLIDSSIRGTRKGIDIVVKAGPYGAVKTDSLNYEYYNSGVRDIVENIRKDYGDKTSDQLPKFYINLVKKEDAPENFKDDDPKHINLEFTLVIDGELVAEVKDAVKLSTDPGRDLIFKKFTRKTSKLKKTKVEGKNYTAKEIIEMEKQKQETAKEVIIAEKMKQATEKIKQATEKLKQEKVKESLRQTKETVKEVLKLVKAGFTKAEIKKILKNK